MRVYIGVEFKVYNSLLFQFYAYVYDTWLLLVLLMMMWKLPPFPPDFIFPLTLIQLRATLYEVQRLDYIYCIYCSFTLHTASLNASFMIPVPTYA